MADTANAAAAMDTSEEIDLFEIEAQQPVSLEAPLLPMEGVLAAPATLGGGDSEEGEELLTDASALALLEPCAELIPIEHAEEYSNWPVEESVPEPVAVAEESAMANQIALFEDFEALFVPPSKTTPPPGRSRRRRR